MCPFAFAILSINAINFGRTIAVPATTRDTNRDDDDNSDIILMPSGGRSRSFSEKAHLWEKVIPYVIDA
uniref:Secreted protein n=1 Tax=Romanomermis culicivorax TaxID=13658 RepID=A0A915IKJ8_ROMCU